MKKIIVILVVIACILLVSATAEAQIPIMSGILGEKKPEPMFPTWKIIAIAVMIFVPFGLLASMARQR